LSSFLQLAETRAQLSEAATREETSQLELDAATADVSSERELSAANARRGVASDALRVEADGAQQRAEAAQEVAGSTCAHSPAPFGRTNRSRVCRISLHKQTYYSLQRRKRKSERSRNDPSAILEPMRLTLLFGRHRSCGCVWPG
jgi:hypothetical protein